MPVKKKTSRNNTILLRQSDDRRRQKHLTSNKSDDKPKNATNFIVDLKNVDVSKWSIDAGNNVFGDEKKLPLDESQSDKGTDNKDSAASTEKDTKEQKSESLKTSRTLVSAVATNNKTLLEELLSKSMASQTAPVKIQSYERELYNALMMAITNNNLAFVQRLLEAGANIKEREETVVILCVDLRATEIFDELMKHTDKYDVSTKYGNIAHAAARTNNPYILKKAAEHDVDLNVQTEKAGLTPLHEAVRHVRATPQKPKTSFFEQVATTSDLSWKSELPTKRSFSSKDSDEKLMLKEDIKKSDDIRLPNYDLECIDFLLEKKCQVNLPDSSGKTPLHYAAMQGNIPVLQKLLRAGSEMTICDSEKHTPFWYLMSNTFSNAIQTIFDDDLVAEHMKQPLDSSGQNYLHLACSLGNRKALEFFIQADFDINTMHENQTPLMIAISHDKLDCAELLLNTPNCYLNFVNNEKKSAFTLLLEHDTNMMKREQILRLLIAKGVEINSVLPGTKTLPLHSLIMLGKGKCAKLLLNQGADPNKKSVAGVTALDIACEELDFELISSIIDHDFDMTLSSRMSNDCTDMTPLHNVMMQMLDSNEAIKIAALLLANNVSTVGMEDFFESVDGKNIIENGVQNTNTIAAHIKSLTPTTLSLQDLTRQTIRRSLGSKKENKKFELLPLPTSLKKYIREPKFNQEFCEQLGVNVL